MCVFDVRNHAAIEAIFAQHGTRVAGVVTEVTTNPLMQTPDLPWLADLARRHGALMLVDPSITSPYNVDVAPYADVVLNSLTKYAAAGHKARPPHGGSPSSRLRPAGPWGQRTTRAAARRNEVLRFR